jgi:hypothetical protein
MLAIVGDFFLALDAAAQAFGGKTLEQIVRERMAERLRIAGIYPS